MRDLGRPTPPVALSPGAAMRSHWKLARVLFLPLAVSCGGRGAAAGDSAAAPDTAAVRGAQSALYPTPATVDSAVKADSGDSASARKRR